MARFGFHLLVGTALIAAAGCAHQPQRADLNPPAAAGSATAPATSPSATASLEAMKKDVSPRLLVFAHEQGFTQVAIKSNDYYFCKTEDPMGSIIPVYQCMDRTQLESLQAQVEQQRLVQFSRQAAQTTHHKDQ
ncbi:MAG: hypothetical protein KGO22_14130 [Gammaproteobacteria bacterium]|nr:hypothetical protein [Gammaproteobacteria bacterium]